ncbi:MAG: glycoside hydrolase family 13 protein [bacterium]|nr:glycoside hydrolase family 13 protein [bacterium]
MAQNALSLEVYRRLRPEGPLHLPPHAHPRNSLVTMTLEHVLNSAQLHGREPEIVLTDTRRDYTWKVGMLPTDDPQTWRAELRLPSEPTIVRYHFLVGREKVLERRQVDGHNRPVYDQWTEDEFKIAVYEADGMPADWTKGMIVYQIFPDRFAKAQSDAQAQAAMRGVYGHQPLFKAWGDMPEAPPLGRDFYGGDLRGIIDRLDYLADLGVECLYLNPIFEASTNHRYDAVDFLKIDPMLGTEADFDALLEEAHRRDIKIVLDAVFNHCSSDSVYFDIVGRYGDKAQPETLGAYQSKRSPYYRWFKFGDWPHKYDGWEGLGFMPEFVECPEMEEFFLGKEGVTAYWLQRGIDGWRCDVADDNTDIFWRRFRRRINEIKPGAYTISEYWRDSTHYLLGDMYNATMNYRFAWAVRGFLATDDITPSQMDDRLQTWLRDTPPPAVHSQMNLLDSHDTDRILTACRGDRARLKQITAFQLAYPGAPCIYYGNETGLEGAFAEDGRRTMPWDNLDSELHTFFRQAMTTRKASRALRLGTLETILLDDDRRLYGFARRDGNEIVLALFNGGAAVAEVALPLAADEAGYYEDALGGHAPAESRDNTLSVQLQPHGAAWYMRVAGG